MIFAHDDSIIDDLCKCLSTKFLLKDEGDIEGFLSVQITHMTKPNGSITITIMQPGLIDQILDDIGLTSDKVTQKCTPVTKILCLIPTLLCLMLPGPTAL